MSHFPLISIVTSSLNNCITLKETIDNIAEQTYSKIEYIVIDGGSQDGTATLLQNSGNIVSHWISEPDQGIYDAWNKGVRYANGVYIAFLGAGDKYLINGLNALAKLALANTNADFICGQVSLQSSRQHVRVIGKPWDWSLFRHYMCTSHVGALHSRRLFDRYGLFDINYRIAGDYELLLRPGKDLNAAFLNHPVAMMLPDGISQRDHRVFYEAKKAKLQHKAVSRLIAQYDFFLAFLKLFIRQNFLS